jgi:hypothetical protein
MRFYDEQLDAELPRMYDKAKAIHHAGNSLAAHRFANLARGLHTLVAEVTEITEKVDNALQVTEDVYLPCLCCRVGAVSRASCQRRGGS